MSDLPFKDNTFNIVSGFETTYFWPDLVNDFREIHRVLKKDGVIFICNGDKKDENLMDRLGDVVNLGHDSIIRKRIT
ncbi:methyltransferase domain-containing protein [Methanosphaera sp. Vir-13MRS]|uniref:methyltransferase domain-containing protein n=1 Tax=Candidatus Methanosphaera massiliense TaxID=3017187 RepID=UPI0023809561|nr:methyltransferase domain-containing protein [Candidatus Methanosphaera massiliense]MDE4078687.1 methyltransferase domain-containing protein [Candidatus Methanosphaera massiliense]